MESGALEPPHYRQRPPLLQAVALTKHYGDHATLTEVGLSVQEGEVLGLIGPNGAGKTTLLEAIAGVLPVDAGYVLWRGVSVARRRDHVFYLPDGVRPYGDQYVERVLSFFAGVYRQPAKQVDDVASAVGLTPMRGQRVRSLSKGFARRLMWALGLLTPHPVLLMDEPFDGFDLKQTREMMVLLRKVVASGRTLVLSIHQLLDAERVCDRFVLLVDGRVRGAGTLNELRLRTKLPAGTLEDIFLAIT
jgi:ABC-type multidrug transport system ATPase subunit